MKMAISGKVLIVGLVIGLAIGLVAGYGVGFITYQPQISQLQSDLSETQSSLSETQLALSKSQSEVDSLQGQLTEAQTKLEEAQAKISNLTLTLKSVQTELSAMEAELTDAKSTIADLMGQMEELQQIAEESKFRFYYASLAEQRYGVDDLKEYLDRWEWSEGAYTGDVFDCSEMSAYLEWKLENEGYHTVIVAGEAPWGNGYHAWLLVEVEPEGYMPVEATTYDLVGWDDPSFDNYFVYELEFENIQDALEYSYEEFDWWEFL